ncbi:unnamed protein product [Moneuplotes crassus]|uniref:Uncharacterized protein n=1 Tax=Euplotes crassus TaxID=5936 RepID=A0AAD1UKP8_EUPCR|nr:unnamed protein product [Moneuplotes crassus]
MCQTQCKSTIDKFPPLPEAIKSLNKSHASQRRKKKDQKKYKIRWQPHPKDNEDYMTFDCLSPDQTQRNNWKIIHDLIILKSSNEYKKIIEALRRKDDQPAYLKLFLKARNRNLNPCRSKADNTLSELSRTAKEVYKIRYKDGSRKKRVKKPTIEKSMRLKVEREIIPKASFLMENLAPLRKKNTMQFNDLPLPQKAESVKNKSLSSCESSQSYGGYQINIKADNEFKKSRASIIPKQHEGQKEIKDESKESGGTSKDPTESLVTSSLSNTSSYTSSKVSRNEDFLKGSEQQKLEFMKICHLETFTRRRSNLDNIRTKIKPHKEMKARVARKSRKTLLKSEFSQMVNEIRVRHNLVRGSKIYKKKTIISKLGFIKPHRVGNKSSQKEFNALLRKNGSTFFSSKQMIKPLDFIKLKRTNTQGPIEANPKNLIEKENEKKNHRRESVSNYSILSIQKEKDQMANRMNSIIQKSPTLSRYKRRSTFMSRLPQTIKKVMNLQVSKPPERRNSFQSGILSLNPNGEDSDELSAIESEENSDSKEKNQSTKKETSSITPKLKGKDRSKAYQRAYRNLKQKFFKEIKVENSIGKVGGHSNKYLYKKDLKLYDKDSTKIFGNTTIDTTYVHQKIEALKSINGKMVGDMMKVLRNKHKRNKHCKRRLLSSHISPKISINTPSQIQVYKSRRRKRPLQASKELSMNTFSSIRSIRQSTKSKINSNIKTKIETPASYRKNFNSPILKLSQRNTQFSNAIPDSEDQTPQIRFMSAHTIERRPIQSRNVSNMHLSQFSPIHHTARAQLFALKKLKKCNRDEIDSKKSPKAADRSHLKNVFFSPTVEKLKKKPRIIISKEHTKHSILSEGAIKSSLCSKRRAVNPAFRCKKKISNVKRRILSPKCAINNSLLLNKDLKELDHYGDSNTIASKIMENPRSTDQSNTRRDMDIHDTFAITSPGLILA